MTGFFQATVLLWVFAASTAVPATEPLTDCRNLAQAIEDKPAIDLDRAEYESFLNTCSAAEQLRIDGNATEAENMFRLGLLKGNLLLAKERPVRPPPAAAARQTAVFSSSSSSAAVKAEVSSTRPAEAARTVDADRPVSERIVGGQGVYQVKKKESLRLVASRLGVRLKILAAMNNLKADATVYPGQELHYNNRRIIPKKLHNGIVVNIPDRSLYLFKNGRVEASYPVALGIAKKGESTVWRTPVGKFRVVEKKENPAWRIPPSIRKEMEENGEEVVAIMPPGPKNPLGKYAIRTDLSGIMIHSTTRPASINSYSSHGCIRVMPEHMERLFRAVAVPMSGEIVYKPVKVDVTKDGRVFLEVNSDSYEQVEDLAAEVRKALKKNNALQKVSWNLVDQVLSQKAGIAEDVTLIEPD